MTPMRKKIGRYYNAMDLNDRLTRKENDVGRAWRNKLTEKASPLVSTDLKVCTQCSCIMFPWRLCSNHSFYTSLKYGFTQYGLWRSLFVVGGFV
jgi:hypothetical protein